MCGITGAIWTEPHPAISQSTLARMVEVLTHRGPDDQGLFFRSLQDDSLHPRTGVALGHRRLSIIDLTGGHQPMANEDGTIQIVFNGEIYNYRDLRPPLVEQGHRFRTESDTEVLVHLYEEHGVDFLEHLNGMFSLALWDAGRNRLLLARDRLGQKPLFYRLETDRLLFASELKSLLQVPGIPRTIDPTALDDYLTYQYVPHPKCIFEGFAKLPPAHRAIWENGRFRVESYWNPDFNHQQELSYTEWSEGLRARLTDAVRLRLRSDVPLGAFLSGGVDSTVIVGLMQQILAEENGEPVRTFSIGFTEPEYDETAYAQLASEHLETDHRPFVVTPDAMSVLPKLLWHYDEPFADSSAIPTWYVAQLTREHVTVALSGDGGDELFAGYDRYRAVGLGRWLDRLPALLRRMVAHPLWQKLPASTRQKSTRRRLKRFLEAAGMPPLERYLQWIAIFNRQRRELLYTSDFVGTLGGYDSLDFLRQGAARSDRRDPVTNISLTDLVTYLPGDLMTKADIASMAHGLECRQPFLDHRVVEWAAAMPIGCKLFQRQGKHILRDTFSPLLPPRIDRRKKMGFGVPLDHWFRGPLASFAREVLTDRVCRRRGYFRPEVIEQLLDEHTQNVFDHAYRLWALLFLELWMRDWLDDF